MLRNLGIYCICWLTVLGCGHRSGPPVGPIPNRTCKVSAVHGASPQTPVAADEDDCPDGYHCDCEAAGVPDENGRTICSYACYPDGQSAVARP